MFIQHLGSNNRYINVTQDTILPPVCWGSCVDCLAPQSSYSVTFRLDMSNMTGFNIPEVNGSLTTGVGLLTICLMLIMMMFGNLLLR